MKNYLVYIVLVLTLFACKAGKEQSEHKKVKTVLHYAKHFELQTYADRIELFIKNPKTGLVEKKLWIAEENSTIPKDYLYIKPSTIRLAPLATNYLGMLCKLEQRAKIAAVGNPSFIYDSTIKNRVKKGSIGEIVDEQNIPFQTLLNAKVNCIVFSGFGTAFPNEDKWKKLNIQVIQNYDWEELHPLGKAEWIKFFGALTGKLPEANAYFEKLKTRYLKLKQMAKLQNDKFVFSGNIVGDVWYMPGGKSYMSQLFRDAGMNYRHYDDSTTGSIPLNPENVFQTHSKDAIWLNPGIPNRTLLKRQFPKIVHFKAYQTNEIYCYSHAMNKYWELSAIEPDQILNDYIQILKGKSDKSLYFYKKVR